MNIFENLDPVWQVVIASCFTWLITALGASLVFFFKKVNRTVLDVMMGFAAGVMIAASFWSLLQPAIDLSEELGNLPYLLPALGFLSGGILIIISANLLDKFGFLKNLDSQKSSTFKRNTLLVGSITLHNIPEGMAVGVAFGGIVAGVAGSNLLGAILLALGIGLQNFPEGASVSLPLRRDGMSRTKAFFFGQASGFVEPISALLGYFLALSIRSVLPFLLAFSAGAMISVVVRELIPESTEQKKDYATMGAILGFIVMMVMDVALG